MTMTHCAEVFVLTYRVKLIDTQLYYQELEGFITEIRQYLVFDRKS